MSGTYDRLRLEQKVQRYCEAEDTTIANRLGFGTQGMVFRTERNTAIKVYDRPEGFARERDVYCRLRDRKIDSIRGLTIPRIRSWNNELLVFEMSVVHVPCIIDFGSTYLDECPEHLLRDEEWHAEKAEDFGEYWQEAQRVIRELEFRGSLWLADVHPNNIKFE